MTRSGRISGSSWSRARIHPHGGVSFVRALGRTIGHVSERIPRTCQPTADLKGQCPTPTTGPRTQFRNATNETAKSFTILVNGGADDRRVSSRPRDSDLLGTWTGGPLHDAQGQEIVAVENASCVHETWP